MIENIIPIVISLKHKLEEEKSPLIDDLMNCLRELMKDYKNEVKDMLAADKQLATEIEFDLKRWEEEQQRNAEARKETQVSPRAPWRPRYGISCTNPESSCQSFCVLLCTHRGCARECVRYLYDFATTYTVVIY